jgi:restriction system protein
MSATPTWEQFNVPVLTVLSDGATRSLRQLRRDVADAVGLTAEQRAESLPSGQLRADNRIGWAASFLNRVDALERPSRGQYVITDFGRELLARHPQGITESDLKAVAKEGDEWWLSRSSADGQEVQPLDTSATDLDPTEQVEQGVARIHEEVASELLSRLVPCSAHRRA